MEEGSPEGAATMGVIPADGYMLVKRAGSRGEIPQCYHLLPSRIPLRLPWLTQQEARGKGASRTQSAGLSPPSTETGKEKSGGRGDKRE